MLVRARIFQRNVKHLFIVWPMLVLIGCANQAEKPPAVPKQHPLPLTTVEASEPFKQETLYSLLSAEIGLVRGRYELGLNNYIQQARDTQDLNVTARATEVARILKRHPESLEMAEQWRALDPSSEEARFILISEYTTSGQYLDAFREAKRLLVAGKQPKFSDIAINASRNENTDNATLTEEFEEAVLQYPSNIELLIGSSVLLHQQEQYDLALARTESAEAIEPDNVHAIYQRFVTLRSMGRGLEATNAYGLLVKIQPENREIRKSYARMLVDHDLTAAQEQYVMLHESDASDSESKVALAITQHELGDLDEAERHFVELLNQGKHTAIANFSLGQMAYEREDYQTALKHYSEVNEGRRFVQAATRAANLITDLSGFDQARAFLAEKRQNASEQHQQSLYVVEASTLDSEAAVLLLNQALEKHPSSVNLRYSRGMQFAALRQPERAEQDFLAILDVTPDDANTLNSLGYTLLSQTSRIDEAGQYIKAAIEIDDQNAAILDSMGWYLFKKGDPEKALGYLERAYASFKDDEVAAHLGEVYWALGKRSKAKKTWQEGLELNPNGVFINETIKRLNVPWGE